MAEKFNLMQERTGFLIEIEDLKIEVEKLKADFNQAVELLREMDETGIIDHQAITQFLGGE